MYFLFIFVHVDLEINLIDNEIRSEYVYFSSHIRANQALRNIVAPARLLQVCERHSFPSSYLGIACLVEGFDFNFEIVLYPQKCKSYGKKLLIDISLNNWKVQVDPNNCRSKHCYSN